MLKPETMYDKRKAKTIDIKLNHVCIYWCMVKANNPRIHPKITGLE